MPATIGTVLNHYNVHFYFMETDTNADMDIDARGPFKSKKPEQFHMDTDTDGISEAQSLILDFSQ